MSENKLTEKFIIDNNWDKINQKGQKVLFIYNKYNLFFNRFFLQLEFDLTTKKCLLIKDKITTTKILTNEIIETENKFDELITKKVTDYESILLL